MYVFGHLTRRVPADAQCSFFLSFFLRFIAADVWHSSLRRGTLMPMRVLPPKRFVRQTAQSGCARNTHPLVHTHRVRALQEYIAAEVHFNALVCTTPTTGITQFYGAYRRPYANASPAWHGSHRDVATPTHSVVLLHELCTGGSIADFAASLASAVDTAAGGAMSSAAPEPLPEVRAHRRGHLMRNAAHVRVCRR
jgi:hypothetical protein